MKTMKKIIAITMVMLFIIVLCSCGCANGKVDLKPSELTGAQVQEEFWNNDLDASAERLNGYRAQSVEEVVQNWRQAKMQGNGAILYALYSPDLKELYLNRMKNEFTIWNFYYGKDNERPMEVLLSEPEEIEGDDGKMYYSTVTTILANGTTSSHDIYIEVVDGGYFVTREQAPIGE